MASIGFRFFVLKVFLVLLLLRNTAAQELKAAKKTVVKTGHGFADEERSHTKENTEDDVVASAPEVRIGKIGGRKMKILEEKLRKVESKINAKLNRSSIRHHHHHRHHHHQEEAVNVKMDTFMVFNSDYHMAKPHPPKNN